MKPPPAVLFLLLSFPCSCAVRTTEEAGGADSSAKAFNRVVALHQAGKYAQAEGAARALVVARTKAHGAEAEETLRAQTMLAKILQNEGKNAEAEPLLRHLLPVMTRRLGARHEATLRCRSTLGQALIQQNKNKQAAAEFRSLIPLET